MKRIASIATDALRCVPRILQAEVVWHVSRDTASASATPLFFKGQANLAIFEHLVDLLVPRRGGTMILG